MGVQQADVFQDPVAPRDRGLSDLREDVRSVALKFGVPAALLVLLLAAVLGAVLLQ
jgi:hypothetical protein